MPPDPLTITVDVTDARRFADLWKKTSGQPTAQQIQESYLSGAGRGVEIYMPNRIKDAANMAAKIAANRELYDAAVNRCLAWVPASNSQLRSIYLAMRGLLPEKPLPQIYMVFGGANSGGTAAPGAQVLGLEILCREGPSPERFQAVLRNFFAHETAHTFQHFPSGPQADPLLRHILVEGVADYIASLVTGAPPSAAREAYGRAHEAELWAQFVKDRTVANRGFDPERGYTKPGQAAFGHWLYNEGEGRLPGWEVDMGYWFGMQIAKAYVERAADPHAAIRELLVLENPAEVLRKSGYGTKLGR